MLNHILTGQLKPTQVHFEAPDDAGGESDGTPLSALLGRPLGDDDDTEDEPEAKVPAKETTKPVESPDFDYDKLADKFGAKLADQLKPKETEAKPLSDAERKKLLKIMDLDDEWVNEFHDPTKTKGALERMRTADREHFKVMLASVVQHLESKLSEKISPLEQRKLETDQREVYNSFTTAYPKLVDSKYSELVELGAKKLAGQEFKTQDEGFKALAELVETTVRKFDPTFSLSGGPTGKTQKPSGSRTLPTESSGSGRTGSAGGGDAEKPVSALSVLLGRK